MTISEEMPPASDPGQKEDPARTIAKITELPSGAPSEDLREEILVQLNGERLVKTVTWLCQSVQFLQNWQKSCSTSATMPAAATDAEAQQSSAAPASLEDQMAKLRAEMKYEVDQRKQRDTAHEELLTMRFDCFQRELEACIKGGALDELQKSLIVKVQNIESEMRSSLARMNGSKMEEIKGDSQRLHDRVEKVCASVTAQVRLLEERVTETCGDLSERLRKLEVAAKSSVANDLRAEILALSEKVDGRLSELQDKADSFGPLLESRLSDLRCNEIASICNRLSETEKVASDAAAAIADPPPSPEGLQALEQCKELFVRMEEVEARPIPPADVMEWRASVDSRLQSSEARMWRVESCQGQSPGNEARLPTPGDGARIQVTEQIHCLKRDVTKSLEDVQIGIKEVRRFIGMEESTRGNQIQQDPLEWLEKRVRLLADKTIKTERTQLLRRINEAEDKIQAFAPRFDKLRDELQDMVHSVKVPVQIDEELVEEVERLKSIVECLEACAPKETKKAMQFFRKAGGAVTRDFVPAELEAQMLNVKEEVARALDIQREDAKRTQNNVLEALRGLEREMEIQRSRVSDLTTVQPRCVSLLEALQNGLGITEQPSDCTGGTADGPVLQKPAMQKIEKAIEGIRFPSTWTPQTVLRGGDSSLNSTASTEMWSTMRSGADQGVVGKGMRTSQQTQSCGRLPHLTR